MSDQQTEEIARQLICVGNRAVVMERYLLRKAWGIYYAIWALSILLFIYLPNLLLLIHNIAKWLRYRSATLDELDRIKEIMQEEERLIRNILEIGKRRRDTSMMERVLDSWLAKDIYPGYDISPKDLINFQNDRYKLVLNFLKEEFTRTK